MLKRTFHDLIEIKNKIAKLEKTKPAKRDKKRRRIVHSSSSETEEQSDKDTVRSERKDAQLSTAASSDKSCDAKPSARPSSRRKPSDAKVSRSGNKDSGIRTRFVLAKCSQKIAMADLLTYLPFFINCLPKRTRAV